MVTVNLGGSGGDEDLLFDRDPAVAVNDAVYLSGSNTVNRANASSPSTTPAIGFCVALVGATQCKVRTEKKVGGFSGLTPAASVFLGLSAGAITQTAPTGVGEVVQELALAISATEILLRIDTDATVNS
jgi:hypothetical protein